MNEVWGAQAGGGCESPGPARSAMPSTGYRPVLTHRGTTSTRCDARSSVGTLTSSLATSPRNGFRSGADACVWIERRISSSIAGAAHAVHRSKSPPRTPNSIRLTSEPANASASGEVSTRRASRVRALLPRLRCALRRRRTHRSRRRATPCRATARSPLQCPAVPLPESQAELDAARADSRSARVRSKSASTMRTRRRSTRIAPASRKRVSDLDTVSSVNAR